MPDELTPEAQAEALLQGEGFTITPPVVPAKQSSQWKPLPQEFTLEEVEALAADVSPIFSEVIFVMANEAKDEVEGHTLTASVN